MTTMVLEHEDAGEGAFLQEDEDAPFYGVHSPKAGLATDQELTVQDILDRRPPADILSAPHSRRTRSDRERGPSTTEIRHRLELERLANEQEKTDLLDKALPNWWEYDSGGILLKPRYPAGPPQGDDPEATIGFLPLDHYPNWEALPGEPGFFYDEPPLGHQTGAHPLTLIQQRLDPIVTKPLPLWKQALIGLGLMKDPR
jgi:hypothetical protein